MNNSYLLDPIQILRGPNQTITSDAVLIVNRHIEAFGERAREEEGIEDINQRSLNTAIEQSEQNSFNILKQEDENERTEGIDNNPDVTSLQQQMSTLLENNPNQPTN